MTTQRLVLSCLGLGLLLLLSEASGLSRLGHRVINRPESCVASSLCELCPPEALMTEPCFATGRRVQMTCRKFAEPTVTYASCERTMSDDQIAFFTFEAWTLALGTLAYLVVKRRKLQNQSLYEQRGSNSEERQGLVNNTSSNGRTPQDGRPSPSPRESGPWRRATACL
mmetsp:Transcript_12288/g.40174  ORF Transcript_12288/g.40174 Transcript_12288/m.40174 type:complete len:169 (-) Transcript_12288:929-1435(-)